MEQKENGARNITMQRSFGFEEKGTGSISSRLEVTESKICNLELWVCEIEGIWWIKSKC
jgi:hypothetical protein